MNFSSHRINYPSDILPLINEMGKQQFNAFAFQVYKRLAKMKQGETFSIEKKVSEENRALFIKIACCYIFDFPGFMIFNEKFTLLTCQK